MQLALAGLDAHLARKLDPLYVIHGDETLFAIEAGDAIRAAARRAGAIVHSGPSSQTTVVVRGRPNPLQAAGRDGGLKLMEIKRLREKGHRITLLNEEQFWRLAQRK